MLMTSGILKMLAQVLVILIYARTLSVDDYGYYQTIWLYSGFIGVVSLFGLPLMILSAGFEVVKKYAIKHKTKVTVVALSFFFIPIIILFLIEPGLNHLEKLLIVLFTLAQNISVIRECIVLKAEGHQKVLKANILFTALFIAVHLLLAESFNLSFLIIGLTICFIIKSSFLRKPLIVQDETNNLDPEITVGRQWLLLGLFDLINVLYKWFDKWIILYFITVSQFAIYFNGSYEIPVFGLMVSAVGNIMLVEWGKLNVTGTHIRSLMHQSTNFLATLVLPSFAFLIFNYEAFFILLFSEKYSAATPIFFIAIFILPLRTVNFTAPLQTLRRNDKILTGAIMDICLAIILMFFFYPKFGLNGIILSIVIATWVQAIFYFICIAKYAQLKIASVLPFKNLSIILAFSLVLSWFAKWISKDATVLLQLGIGAVVTCLIIGILLWRHMGKIKEEL